MLWLATHAEVDNTMDILKGLFLLILSRMGFSEIRRKDSNEEKCHFQCRPSQGEFCLNSRCVRCSYCPDNPFDVDWEGRLDVYEPCIRFGFCPKICSSSLALGSLPRANETLCQRFKKPKVSKPKTPQPVSTTGYETTTARASSPNDAIITRLIFTSERTYNGTSPALTTTNLTEESRDFLQGMIIAGVFLVALVIAVKLSRKLRCWIKRFFTSSPEEFPMIPMTDQPLDIQLDPQRKAATVKGLKGLNCNALQLCACLHNPNNPVQNWITTSGVDEMDLPGVMIPHQVYTVKAGRVTDRREFECIVERKVNTGEFVNVTLDDACSTTLQDIFGNVSIRKSLQLELSCSSQRDMTDIISTTLELTEDECKSFKGHRCLEKLYDETLTTNDVLDSSIHPMMEGLAEFPEAKDFVRKIAKRDSERYCKKCLELLHGMCCGNLGDIFEVISEDSALTAASCSV